MNISVIIVTFNPEIDKLSNLLDSVLMDKVNIIVVDNNSTNNGEIKKLTKKSHLVNVHVIDYNKGIAFAQNLGIKIAIDNKSDYVLFFDQDSSINHNFINNLYCDFIDLKNKNIKLAAIGPRFIDEKKNFYFPALKLNHYNLIEKINVESIVSPQEVSVLISSGSLVSIESLKKIGIMREEFFIDFVDTEWCFRALSKGYKIFISSSAIMKHSIGDDTIEILNFKIPVHSGYRRYFRIRNLFFMWKMSYIPKQLTFKLMLSNFFHQVLLFILKRNKWDYIRYYYKGVKDGVKQSKKINFD
ncbi:glycosyltransferase family 2 protein [Acinetobacter baumannii]|uniref:Glycosyltransferase n=1 Tax=Acinetobacter baumannii TaxID=470 RepID=A0A7S8ITX9_ACIBA|nr:MULTISPECIES: glycosyltransferase family 2 protein [Acinetobacter calcoaceticus/baumannii complex]KMV26002.1 rhamnosyltransferase family protein [Acinetobacter baumannii]MCT9270378.1 glycosyltransferase family 2 protein [Acinetobacter baumannii]MDN8319313.1 glycosyltransferase family 2 protein [Acinetobacter baumannii]QPD01063.1 glycosyltransferase [Acinetobacter baumannii]